MTVSAVNNGTPASAPATDAALEARKERLWRAAQGIEEMFMGDLLNQMNKGVSEDTLLHGGPGEKMFQQQLNAAYAERAAAANSRESGRGIANMVYEQMLKRDPRLAEAKRRIDEAHAKIMTLTNTDESSANLRASFSTTG